MFLNGETNYSIEVGVATHQIEANNPIDDFCLVRWCFGRFLAVGQMATMMMVNLCNLCRGIGQGPSKPVHRCPKRQRQVDGVTIEC